MGGGAFSQNILSGASLTSFPEAERRILTEKIQAFDVFQFPTLELNTLVKSAGNNETTIRIQIGNQYDWSMTIEENDIRTSGFQIVEMTDNGPIYHPKNNVVNTYKGFVDGDESQWVRCFISDSKFGMSFLADGVVYRVAPLSRYLSGHQYDDSYLLFKQSDVVASERICATQSGQSSETASPTPSGDSDPKVRYLELATDVDYEFYQKYKDEGTGAAIANVNNRVEEILNEVDRRYSELRILLYIQHVVSHVWSTSNDPYSSSNNIVKKWEEFELAWRNDFKCTQRDAAVLFSGRKLGALGVVKYRGDGSICGNEYTSCGTYQQFSYAVVRGTDGYVSSTTTHELGHIIGLQHTCKYCGLMNPGDCDPIPCGSNSTPYEFSEHSIEKLNEILSGYLHKCNGAVYGDFPRDNCLISPGTVLGDEIIDVNTIWTAATVPNGGKLKYLSIEGNATLTLMPDVTLSFPVDGSVDIDEGATLINYGRLTGCEDYWEGVTAWGNGASEPITAQGYYKGMPKSIIENAKVAVQTLNGPAVVKVYKARFLNNEVAIKLDGVVNYNDPIPSLPSKSMIRGSEFSVNEDMSGNLTFKSFIDLHKMNMTKFYQFGSNKFFVDMSAPPIPNQGIIAKSSNITVGYNVLDGLHTGIEVHDGFAYIHENNITRNKYGLFLRGVAVNNIIFNQFSLGNLPETYLKTDCSDPTIPNCTDNQQFGAIIESAVSGFNLTRNVFKKEQGNPYIFTFGTLCTNMGENKYTIKDNSFSELTIANVAHKLNGRAGILSNNSGLKYLCNHLTYNSSDFYVTSDPTSIIHPKQGIYTDEGQSRPAFNEFSFSLPSASWDYRNHYPANITSVEFEYFFNPEDPNTIPREGHYENIHIKAADVYSNYCYVKPSDPDPDTSIPDKSKLIKFYPTPIEKANNRNRYFEAYQAYERASLEKEQAAIQNNATLLEQKSRMSQYYRAEADDAAYQGYIYAVMDTTGSDFDSIPVWLERMHTFEAEVGRANWYRQNGQFAVSEVILDQIPTSFELSAAYAEDLALYRSLRDLTSDVLEDDDFYQLESAAESDYRLSSAFAKNVLSQHGVYSPPIGFEMPDDLKNTVTESTTEEARLKVIVTPNPATAFVLFDWSQFNVGSDPINIELRDRLGNLLDVVTSAPGQYSKEVSLETYRDGVIFYYFTHNEKLLDSGQLILNK